MQEVKCGCRLGARRLRCQECGAVFEPWDDIFTWDFGGRTELICEDCFDGLFDELSRHEKAEIIGSRVMTAEEFLAR